MGPSCSFLIGYSFDIGAMASRNRKALEAMHWLYMTNLFGEPTFRQHRMAETQILERNKLPFIYKYTALRLVQLTEVVCRSKYHPYVLWLPILDRGVLKR